MTTDEATTITVIIQTAPPNILLPNQRRRAHWGIVSRATAEFREQAGWDAKTAIPRDWTCVTDPFELHLHVEWPKRKLTVPDLDGTANAAKAAIDALQDVGIIEDDCLMQSLLVTQSKGDSASGTTTLTIRPATHQEGTKAA